MGNHYKITEEQLRHLITIDVNKIKSWKYYGNFNGFIEKYPDHTYEFNWFTSEETDLDNEILLDECANYIHDRHPLFMYVRNGEKLSENLIPIAVHRYKPFILDKKNKNKTIGEKTTKGIYPNR